MILYTVKYRELGTKKWTEIKNVKGDGILENNIVRWFITEDETRYEISLNNIEIIFSKERYLGIIERMNNESNNQINIKKR